MNVEMTAVPELECAGAEVKGRTLSVQPVFWNPKEIANTASIVVKNNAGKVLFKGMIRVSGQTGKPTIVERSTPVTPAADRGSSQKK
jgi:hypothetical protein